MQIKQISVFVENVQGRLFELTDVLAKHGIDIEAISIADTADFGILRCIVNRPDEAVEVLKKAGFTASTTKVLAVEMEDTPGGLSKILGFLANEGIALDYLYSFVRQVKGKALILFKVNDPDKAVDVLLQNGVHILCMEDILGGK